MKRELLLLRHGKSDWNRSMDDLYRPLKKRGRKDAGQMGRWMKSRGFVPDYVLSSPAVRALETARVVCMELGFSAKNIQMDPLLYGADEKELLHAVHSVPAKVCRVLLVGHNPGLEDLVMTLARGNFQLPLAGKFFPTSALAWFRMEAAWVECRPDTVQCFALQRPRTLEDAV